MATGAIRRAKLQSYRSPPTNQQPARYRPDALPVAQPTVKETLKQKLLFSFIHSFIYSVKSKRFCSKSGPNVPQLHNKYMTILKCSKTVYVESQKEDLSCAM